jgi:hypothetical protein
MQFRQELRIPHNAPPPGQRQVFCNKTLQGFVSQIVSTDRRGWLTFVAVSRPIKEAR